MSPCKFKGKYERGDSFPLYLNQTEIRLEVNRRDHISFPSGGVLELILSQEPPPPSIPFIRIGGEADI